jgi:hypothetical protein
VTNEWLNFNIIGQIPSSRQHHTVNVIDNCLWVFGGKNTRTLAGIYCLHTSTKQSTFTNLFIRFKLLSQSFELELNIMRTPRFGEELGRNLKKLLFSQRFTDFTVPVQPNKIINLHQFILTVRCPKLLSNPMLFQEQNFTFDEAMQLLELIYTNKIPYNKQVLLNKKIWAMTKYLEKSQVRFLQEHLKRYVFQGSPSQLFVHCFCKIIEQTHIFLSFEY